MVVVLQELNFEFKDVMRLVVEAIGLEPSELDRLLGVSPPESEQPESV